MAGERWEQTHLLSIEAARNSDQLRQIVWDTIEGFEYTGWNDPRYYWGYDSHVHQGRPPYGADELATKTFLCPYAPLAAGLKFGEGWQETTPAQERTKRSSMAFTIPQGTPDFLDFPRFAGKLQSLNTPNFWTQVAKLYPNHMDWVEAFDEDSLNDAAHALGWDGRHFFETTMIMSAFASVFGDQTDPATSNFDKTSRVYRAPNSTFGKDEGIIGSFDQLRDRLIQQFSRNEDAVIPMYEAVKITDVMGHCPARALTEGIFESLGLYFQDNDKWDKFVKDVSESTESR